MLDGNTTTTAAPGPSITITLPSSAEDTGPFDYIASLELLMFTSLCGACIAFVIFKRHTPTIKALAPWWLFVLMMGGAAVHVVSTFISNGHLSVLRSVPLLHCTVFDFWLVLAGFGMWFYFFAASIMSMIAYNFQTAYDDAVRHGLDKSCSLVVDIGLERRPLHEEVIVVDDGDDNGVEVKIQRVGSDSSRVVQSMVRMEDDEEEPEMHADNVQPPKQHSVEYLDRVRRDNAEEMHHNEQRALRQLRLLEMRDRRRSRDISKCLGLAYLVGEIVLRVRMTLSACKVVIARRLRRIYHPIWFRLSRRRIIALLRLAAFVITLGPLMTVCLVVELAHGSQVDVDGTGACKARWWAKLSMILVLYGEIALMSTILMYARSRKQIFWDEDRQYMRVLGLGFFVLTTLVIFNLLGLTLLEVGRFLFLNTLALFYGLTFLLLLWPTLYDALVSGDVRTTVIMNSLCGLCCCIATCAHCIPIVPFVMRWAFAMPEHHPHSDNLTMDGLQLRSSTGLFFDRLRDTQECARCVGLLCPHMSRSNNVDYTEHPCMRWIHYPTHEGPFARKFQQRALDCALPSNLDEIRARRDVFHEFIEWVKARPLFLVDRDCKVNPDGRRFDWKLYTDQTTEVQQHFVGSPAKLAQLLVVLGRRRLLCNAYGESHTLGVQNAFSPYSNASGDIGQDREAHMRHMFENIVTLNESITGVMLTPQDEMLTSLEVATWQSDTLDSDERRRRRSLVTDDMDVDGDADDDDEEMFSVSDAGASENWAYRLPALGKSNVATTRLGNAHAFTNALPVDPLYLDKLRRETTVTDLRFDVRQRAPTANVMRDFDSASPLGSGRGDRVCDPDAYDMIEAAILEILSLLFVTDFLADPTTMKRARHDASVFDMLRAQIPPQQQQQKQQSQYPPHQDYFPTSAFA